MTSLRQLILEARTVLAMLVPLAVIAAVLACGGDAATQHHVRVATHRRHTATVTRNIQVIDTHAIYVCRRTFGSSLYDPVAKKTFVTFNSTLGRIYVTSYDNDPARNPNHLWSTPVFVADFNVSHGFAQYHQYSVMELLPDGHLGIFRSYSDGVGTYLYRSPGVHSEAGVWGAPVVMVAPTDHWGGNYPTPAVIGSTVYFAYGVSPYGQSAGAPTYRYIGMIKSVDSGRTWQNLAGQSVSSYGPTRVIDTGKNMGTTPGVHDYYDGPFVYSRQVFGSRVYFTFSLTGDPADRTFNQTARDLFLVYYDAADNQMHAPDGTSLGTTVDCAGVGSCDEFVGHGVRVAISTPDTATPNVFPGCTQSVCYSPANYDLRHPVTMSAVDLTSDGTPVVAYGDYHSASRKIKLARFSDGVWGSFTLDRTTAQFKDVQRWGTSYFRLMWVTEDGATLRTRTIDPATGTMYAAYPDLAVPLRRSCGAIQSFSPASNSDCHDPDRTFFINWVEDAPYTGVGMETVKAVGGTFDYETRIADGSGDFTTFALVEARS